MSANGNRTVSMSILQRIGLDNILAEQKGKREDLRTFYNIRRKVRVPFDERALYVRTLGNGASVFDESAAAVAEPKEISFDGDEVRRLIKLGDTMEMPCGILDWFEPLLLELEHKDAG